MKIGVRLGTGFGLIGLLFVLMVVGSNTMLSRLNDETAEIVKRRIPLMDLTARYDTQISAMAIAMRNMMLTDDVGDRQRQHELVMQSRLAMRDILAQLEKGLRSAESRRIREQMAQANADYDRGQDQLLKLINDGERVAASAFLNGEMRPRLAKLREAAAAQMAQQRKLTEGAAKLSEEIYASTHLLTLLSGLATLIIGALVAWRLTRSITHPMQQAVLMASKVAEGDLTSQIEVRTSDETGQLLRALAEMNAQLSSTVGSVRLGADTIAVAAAQVAAGNHDLSARTEQQASALEETASSMEELTSTVKQNADNARQANVLAESASQVAQRGGTVITQVVDTMDDINASASKISDIIGVIDGIAFQTNILALNAAVEAARAGEQGRGFAVVAGEVRNLAQRSAAAAREIKTLIIDSTNKTSAGSKLVIEAGSTMKEIVESVRRVTDIMAEISAASHEQTAGIEQINQAVNQLDESTQQNAALVEQAAAASGAMQEQAGRLAEAVSVFRIAPTGQQTVSMTGTRAQPSRLLGNAA